LTALLVPLSHGIRKGVFSLVWTKCNLGSPDLLRCLFS
jgi:hypothetical protein